MSSSIAACCGVAGSTAAFRHAKFDVGGPCALLRHLSAVVFARQDPAIVRELGLRTTIQLSAGPHLVFQTATCRSTLLPIRANRSILFAHSMEISRLRMSEGSHRASRSAAPTRRSVVTHFRCGGEPPTINANITNPAHDPRPSKIQQRLLKIPAIDRCSLQRLMSA